MTPEKEEMIIKAKEVNVVAETFAKIFSIISFSVLAVFLLYFNRVRFEKSIKSIITKPFISGLIGFATLVVAPFVFIILMITIIGIPLAFFGIAFYVMSLISASIYFSGTIGKLFFEKVLKDSKTNIYWQVIVGVALVGIISLIPMLGGLFIFVGFCLGLGSTISSYFPENK
jgi:hypothetical protein